MTSTRMNRKTNPRSGMAIIIALFFAFCLLVLFVGMFTMNRNVASHNRLSLQQQQAFFAARAALQHLLLKAKLFPTELYDAVEFAQGKNPLFDFTEYPRQDSNGQEAFQAYPGVPNMFKRILPSQELDVTGTKPKYFYVAFSDRPEVLIRIGNFYNPEFRFIDKSIIGGGPDSKKYTTPNVSGINEAKRNCYLDYFTRDVTNGKVNGADIQPALIMNKAPSIRTSRDFKIDMEGYPYSMTYTVEEIKVGALRDLRRYNEEAIEIRVVGTIEDFQGKKYTQVQKKIQKITRRGSLD